MKQSYLMLAVFLSLVLGCTAFSTLTFAAKTDGGQQTMVANMDKATVMQKVNVNTANKTELIRVPGIGNKTADSILKYRNDHGKFTTITQLTEVKGIGSKSLKKMEKYLSL
ncbi:ComEA family DNA-binding protein [Desulfotalea psychrophila]|uniref:Helix-hairpin-helix DNA-binding motif class 1 domain-containing protein n=1 Tax=Desulfotalea psychrophila (strain LSv54 / DSM 12343) TaxID=177439 RepID=Q6AL09_DESPS|nr:helix-hairpin-helix domain-containing protein [Desulfotalea psychrophila]CAG36966.1 hypothetical protein DP2237 [Desulfotalea psychrophila LSv54]